MPIASGSYTRLSRTPRYSLVFALPLLVLYEILAFAMSGDAITGVRNGADVLLKSVFIALGGRSGVAAFGVLLVGGGAVLVWRDMRTHGGRLRGRVFALMLAESVGYGLMIGVVTGTLTGLVLHALPALALAPSPIQRLGLPTQLMISLGAGLYEELLFRVLLVSGLAALARRAFGWRPGVAAAFATLVGAVVFSAFHYIGPYGDELTVGSFTFRLLAGLIFSALYLTRGFGITAWSHALYDIFLSLA
ncbi:MAG: CPBP family intramembrane metalloprotease [Gemmatimonadales bacterium]|nr:CPBP family intramembrane metalloprotease [Gemmatimonadales bacterium]